MCIGKNSRNDKKIIELAVEYILPRQVPYPLIIDSRNEGGKLNLLYNITAQDLILYKNPDEFLLINSDCCTFLNRGKKGYTPTFYQKASGTISRFLEIKYLVRLKSDQKNKHKNLHAIYVGISNCGRIWNGN